MPAPFRGFLSDPFGLQETRDNGREGSGPGFTGSSHKLLLDSPAIDFSTTRVLFSKANTTEARGAAFGA